jgi:hypothetical protein
MLWINKIKKKFVKKTKKKLIGKLIVSRFFKNKINFVFINVISLIIKLHLNSILCFIFCPDISFKDFWLQILVSIFVTFSGDYVLFHLNKYDDDFYKVTRYFLNNLTEDNFDKWKKLLVLGLNVYVIMILLFVSITSYLIIYYCIQYLVFFFILDYFKNKKYMYFVRKYKEYLNKPVIIKKYDTLKIIDEHFEKEGQKELMPKLLIEDVNVDYFNISREGEEKKDEAKKKLDDETKDNLDNEEEKKEERKNSLGNDDEY